LTGKRTVVGLLACNVKMSSSKPKLKVRILDEMFKKNKLHTLTVQTTNSIRQFSTRRIALNERSLDVEDTGIVINTVKIA
jgi:hypothetical protein